MKMEHAYHALRNALEKFAEIMDAVEAVEVVLLDRAAM